MAMVVNHNIPALSTYNVINSTSSALQKSINKLSTGLRINSAADDAAGLAISEKMRAQVRGLDQAVANSQDGISMIQTAEGALSETHSILQRMRELSVQAANDTLTQQDRGYIQEEVDQLREEITRIGNTTQFNKKKLLNGDAAVLWSSDNLETKAVINGGLRTIDQFGQKNSAEGNYKITVKATPGQGEVQKTDIMRIKHDVNPWYSTVNSTYGIASSDKQKAPDIKGGGTYNISGTVIADGEADVESKATLVDHIGGSGELGLTLSGTDLADNHSLKFKVTNVDTSTPGSEKLTLSYSGYSIGKDGKVSDDKIEGTLEISAGGAGGVVTLEDGKTATVGAGLTADNIAKFKKDEEFVYNINAKALNGQDAVVTVSGTPSDGTSVGKMTDHTFTINKADMINSTAEFKVSYTETNPNDPDYVAVQEGSVYLTTNKKFADNVKTGDWATFRKGVDIPKDSDDHWLVGTNSTIDDASSSVSAAMPTGGTYTVTSGAKAAANVANATGLATVKKGSMPSGFSISDGGTFSADDWTGSGILKLSFHDMDNTANTGKATATFWGTDKDGNAIEGETAEIDLSTTATAITVGSAKLGKIGGTAGSFGAAEAKEVYYVMKAAAKTGDLTLTVAGSNSDGQNVLNGGATQFVISKEKFEAADNEISLVTHFNAEGEEIDLIKESGNFGSITLKTSAAADSVDKSANKTLGTFTWGHETTEKISSSIGEVAGNGTKLWDLEKFWDSQGVFMITDPQTLTLTQGDGKQATVTLYKDDTLGDVAKKLNNAIANDLGQKQYVDDATKFATFVDKATDDNTSESVKGTMLIRTVVPGANGTISISGDENIINALSLNTIQKAEESKYTVNIEDAHTGKTVVKDAKITGNKLIGKLNPNVDVEFDAMAGIKAEWDDEKKAFKSSSEDYTTYLHLSDNTTVFQIGANEGEDMGINIGDMRSHALGLDSVNVTNRDSASRSITVIDNAIDKVSMQRSKLGAYQNRLEHTINNLTTASENLTAAESRIRDTDMAKEMMNFSKLQIMLQAGNSMLAQANQLPQNVLSLVR